MSRLFPFIFIISLFACSFSMAQIIDSEPIQLSGQVINQEDKTPVPYVLIYNQNTQKGTSSDSLGYFSIRINPQDSIVFSSMGFEKHVFVLKSPPAASETEVLIKLNIKTYELSSVDIFAFKTEEEFKKYILAMEIPEEESLDIPGLEYRGPARPAGAGGGLVISGPISFLSSNFSRRAKAHKKYLQAKEAYDYNDLVESKFNSEVVKEITGLQGEELTEFMQFCKLPDKFIVSANDYELIVAVHDCYKEFKQKKG